MWSTLLALALAAPQLAQGLLRFPCAQTTVVRSDPYVFAFSHLLLLLTSSFRLVNPDSVGQHLHQVVGGVRTFYFLFPDVGLTKVPHPTEQLRLQHARRL